MITKIVLKHRGEERVIPLDGGRLTFGRKSDNDVCVNDKALSRRHLIFERTGEGWIVRDPGSTNRTYLNGREVRRSRPLRRGDRISAGNVTLVCDGQLGEKDTGDVKFVPEVTSLTPVHTVVRKLDALISEDRREEGGPRLPTRNPAVQAVLRASRELCSRRPLPELFDLILDLSTQAVSGDRGVLMTLEGDELVTRAVRGEGFRIGTAVRDRVMLERASLLVRDAQREAEFAEMQTLIEQHVRTFMAVPLQTQNRVIGLIYVDCQQLRDFGPEDLELLTVLANVAATRIEQERLTLAEEEKQRYEQELEQAASIQNGLLPRAPIVWPHVEVTGFNAACRTVGGDYYDFFPYPDERLALVIGDVAGKGLPAALVMATLQARVQVLIEDGDRVASVMNRLNRVMAKNCSDNRFVTLFFGLLDRDGKLRYSSAGHNPARVVRAGGGGEWLEGRGLPLGLFPDTTYDVFQCELGPGDLLVLYSDGITEAPGARGEQLGGRRLADLADRLRDRSLSDLLESIRDAVDDWTGGAPPEDDITVVAARRT
jgi:serine phosphatase RsbU (regulator of sigma subunit)